MSKHFSKMFYADRTSLLIAIFTHIVLFRFKAKCKPSLKLGLKGLTVLYIVEFAGKILVRRSVIRNKGSCNLTNI